MIFKSSALALVLASQVLASPVLRRQESPASSVVTVSETAATSTATESAQPTPAPAPEASTTPAPEPPSSASEVASSVASEVSSAASEVSSSLAPEASPVPAPVPDAANPAYPCPEGFLLTYVEVQQDYDYPVSEVAPYISDFQNASYFGYVSGTGGSEVGATRDLASGATEVLTQLRTNDGNITAAQDFNLTNGPIDLGNGVTVSNYSNVLQINGNSTLSPEAFENITTAKLFSNFCASDQEAGRMIVMQNFNQTLSSLGALVSGGETEQSGTPEVTQTVESTVVAEPSTTQLSSTDIAAAPTSIVSESVTAEPSTITASETITPVVTTATELSTSTPEPETQTEVVTSTPEAITETAQTTVVPPEETVTAATTVDPLASPSSVTESITAATTTTQA